MICGTGSNDTRHSRADSRRRPRTPAPTPCSSSRRTTTSRTAAGIRAHFEAVAEAAGDRRCVALQHPLAGGGQPPARAARRAGARSRTWSRVKQANDDELAADRRPRACSPATTTPSCATLEIGGAGGILVASHLVGPRDARDLRRGRRPATSTRAREIDADAAADLRGAGGHDQPDPGQGRRWRCSGSARRGLRLPMVAADDEQRAEVRRALEAHGLLAGSAA